MYCNNVEEVASIEDKPISCVEEIASLDDEALKLSAEDEDEDQSTVDEEALTSADEMPISIDENAKPEDEVLTPRTFDEEAVSLDVASAPFVDEA